MQRAMLATRVAAALLLAVRVGGGTTCRQLFADFIVLEGEATLLELEDDIRKDLEVVGVTVTTRTLKKEAFNTAMTSGDFNLAFSETWGPPYDPHSYAKSWAVADEAHFAALKGLPPPMTQKVLGQKIDKVLTMSDEQKRATAWKEILTALHEQAIDLPFSGKRIPAVINRRLSGYVPGLQQFDYPLHTLKVKSGSTTITVAPGARTGLFTQVGPLDPHTYPKNEFFSSNWVYEGLVEYGPGGVIQPSLAVSWTIVETSSGGQEYTFALRTGVKFHDGQDWNCAAAKQNFDNVLAKPLAKTSHSWYGLPGAISSWSCKGTHQLVITTKNQYYPLLQELSYIRPLRMLSPAKFHGGLANNPLTQNTCQGDAVTDGGVTVTCLGILGSSGTGRWSYVETKSSGGKVQEVVFKRNAAHWDAIPAGGVDKLRVIRYDNNAAVKSALIAGTLDLVVGAGVLDPKDISEFQVQRKDTFEVSLTEPLQNRVVILNSAKAPTDELPVRKMIIHAVNKAAIIDKELYGLAEPVDALFPKTAPYCRIDLTPRWDYDLEKAKLLYCPPKTTSSTTKETTKTDHTLIIIISVTVAVVASVIAVGLFFFGRSYGYRMATAKSRDRRENPMVNEAREETPAAGTGV